MVQKKGGSQALVGASNVDVARETLERLRIGIVDEDVGGDMGRRILVNGASLEYEIQHIPRSNEV